MFIVVTQDQTKLVSLSSYTPMAACCTVLPERRHVRGGLLSTIIPFPIPPRRMPNTLSFVPVAVPILGWLLAMLLIFVVHFLASWRRRSHLVGHLPKVSIHRERGRGTRKHREISWKCNSWEGKAQRSMRTWALRTGVNSWPNRSLFDTCE